MDISLELKGLPCLNKVYLLTYLLPIPTPSLPHLIHSHLLNSPSHHLPSLPPPFPNSSHSPPPPFPTSSTLTSSIPLSTTSPPYLLLFPPPLLIPHPSLPHLIHSHLLNCPLHHLPSLPPPFPNSSPNSPLLPFSPHPLPPPQFQFPPPPLPTSFFLTGSHPETFSHLLSSFPTPSLPHLVHFYLFNSPSHHLPSLPFPFPTSLLISHPLHSSAHPLPPPQFPLPSPPLLTSSFSHLPS